MGPDRIAARITSLAYFEQRSLFGLSQAEFPVHLQQKRPVDSRVRDQREASRDNEAERRLGL